MDKKGISVIPIIAFIFLAFFAVIFIGIALYGLDLFDNAMNGMNIMIGTMNFTEVYQDTTQQGVTALNSVADIAGLVLMFGMILIMIFVGYKWGDETKKFWAILDLLIIIVSFVISVYLQGYFNDFINSQVLGGSTIFTDTIPKSSRLLLRLPYIVPVVGILIMIVTYGLNKRKPDQTFSDLGY